MLQHKARSHEDKSDDEAKAWLRETFADARWETPRVLAGLDEADDLYFDVLRQVKMNRWFSGRVALTGDAAWCATPISGIGTTLAVVGAYVLAGELAKTDDHTEALRNYERIMRPFTEQGQGVSKANQFWTHPHSKFGIMIQHAVLGVLAKPGIRDVFLKTGMRESDDIDVPNYAFGGTNRGALTPSRGSDGYVPILRALAQELRTHLAGRRVGTCSRATALIGTRPGPCSSLCRTRPGGEIEKRITPHCLRASGATLLLDAGGSSAGVLVPQVHRYHPDLRPDQHSPMLRALYPSACRPFVAEKERPVYTAQAQTLK